MQNINNTFEETCSPHSIFFHYDINESLTFCLSPDERVPIPNPDLVHRAFGVSESSRIHQIQPEPLQQNLDI